MRQLSQESVKSFLSKPEPRSPVVGWAAIFPEVTFVQVKRTQVQCRLLPCASSCSFLTFFLSAWGHLCYSCNSGWLTFAALYFLIFFSGKDEVSRDGCWWFRESPRGADRDPHRIQSWQDGGQVPKLVDGSSFYLHGAHAHIYTHTHTRTCTHAHTHTHTHTHTSACHLHISYSHWSSSCILFIFLFYSEKVCCSHLL